MAVYHPRVASNRDTRRGATKSEWVADQLREDITAGKIPRGGRLEQRDVAARYGTSATPAREALRQLAAEGILIHTPNAGMTVAEFGADRIDALHEIFLMRKALESMAASEAHQHVTRAQLAELARIHEAFAQAVEEEDLDGLQALNYSFHMHVYRAAAGERLMRSIEQLWTLFPWETVAWSNAYIRDKKQAIDEHQAILAALTTGTGQEAEEAMAVHIEKSFASLADYLLERGEEGPVPEKRTSS